MRVSIKEENSFPSYKLILQDLINEAKIQTKIHEYVLFEIFIDNENFHLIIGHGALELRYDDSFFAVFNN